MPRPKPIAPSGVEVHCEKLREMRKQRGEGLEEFATRAGISFGYLSAIERGRRPTVSPPVFARLCDALEIDKADRAVLLVPAARRRLAAA